MLKLILFTTNRVKLAHVRYMAEGHPVIVESFRRKTFYASYTEPKIDSRDDLLERSYQSALGQAQSSGVNPDKRFFFLEDTSVIIDALSTADREVPGVNIKYWMEDKTFEIVDSILTKQSNREVSVRSDILLHIPSYYRQKWGISDRYIIFVGTQRGAIVGAEHEVKTNLIFPWLDDKTFNKWFVPTGASKPLSCLPIEEATKYDFRFQAFSKMLQFLDKNGALYSPYEQHSLDLNLTSEDTAPTLIICGFPCAGKTTLSQHLVRKYGYVHIEASDFMYLNYYLRHDVNSGIDIADFAEEALKRKPEIAAQKIAEYMEDVRRLPVVISGLRSRREIEWLTGYLEGRTDRKPLILGYVDASQEIRFIRNNRRNRERQEISRDRFQIRDEQQIRMGLGEIASLVDKKVVKNESTYEAFFEAAESIFVSSKESLLGRELDFSVFDEFSENIGLETPIFLALLSEWEDGEGREYFTTTEIAKLVNGLFPSMKPKHKDNVSRYFNQDFYAFYEIDPDLDENKRKYRLSNTGYGRAVSTYYTLKQKIHQ